MKVDKSVEDLIANVNVTFANPIFTDGLYFEISFHERM